MEYQDSATNVSATWHGFTDLTSGMHHYMWCVGATPDPNDCSLKQWVNVGLHTKIAGTIDPLASDGRVNASLVIFSCNNSCYCEGGIASI